MGLSLDVFLTSDVRVLTQWLVTQTPSPSSTALIRFATSSFTESACAFPLDVEESLQEPCTLVVRRALDS